MLEIIAFLLAFYFSLTDGYEAQPIDLPFNLSALPAAAGFSLAPG